MIRIPDHVENEQAYVNAAWAKIRSNKRKTWMRNPDNMALEQQMERHATHPFIAKMLKAIDERGGLSVKQIEAVKNVFARIAERRKERALADNGNSQHVGTIGKRSVITATVTFWTSWRNAYDGVTVLTGLKDDAGNVYIVKGNALGAYLIDGKASKSETAFYATAGKDARVTFKATVKAHTERDGVKQTILNRAVVQELIATADAPPDWRLS